MSTRFGLVCAALLIVVPFAARSAEPPTIDSVTAAIAQLPERQQMLKLPVRVVDAKGNPVANAKVTPWALRCSQGHGGWPKNDERAGVGPEAVVTNDDGTAEVMYPKFRDVEEQVSTISVSLYVDHLDFAHVDRLHIDVPLETDGPYEIALTAGVPLEVRPLIDGKPAELENIFALWSDGRSFQPGAAPEKTSSGALRIPGMRPGKNSVMLVRLDGERATHFSKITDVELEAGNPLKIDVSLHPSRRIEGTLSDNVPRPVRDGRVKAQTLTPADADHSRVSWFTWVPVRPDGTFAIDWPDEEPLQAIALTDDSIATSGNPPNDLTHPYDPKTDGFNRPQMFYPENDQPIEIVMTPLVECVVTAIDEDGKPIAGVEVVSSPNVCWWNGGSQIYCDPLVRGERRLKERNYRNAIDEAFSPPFRSITNGDGKATLKLPAGRERISLLEGVYELPVFLGWRDVKITIAHGRTTETVLRLQPRGTEKLGEWDKLAGVVFGCSTREGRRICALPGVRKQMDEFVARFQEGKNQRDPELLAEAYTFVADAFASVGDAEEASKWRQKATEQQAKAEQAAVDTAK